MATVVPLNTGLIIWSMPNNLKGFGNGISNLMTTILGKLPAPFIYGYLQYNLKKFNKKIGMIFLMTFSFLGVIYLGLATIFRYKNSYLEIEKICEDNKKDKKRHITDSFRRSIDNEVISSVYNNDVTFYKNYEIKSDENKDEENEEEDLDSIYSYKTDSSNYTEIMNIN